MLANRVNKLKRNLRRKPRTDKLDIKPRHPALTAVEGWYTCSADLNGLPYRYQHLVSQYKASESRLKFTRWLSRNDLLPHSEIVKIGELLVDVTFKISCRHNDLVRLAETSHYESCFKGWRGVQQLRYLADPDLAVVYVPDKSGKFMWRSLIRLMIDPQNPNGFAFAIYKPYGNSNVLSIYKKLDSIYPLYNQESRYSYNVERKTLSSASVHSNNIVGYHVWSDHWCQLDVVTKRLQMLCRRFDPNTATTFFLQY
jgi:hypothetical protein